MGEGDAARAELKAVTRWLGLGPSPAVVDLAGWAASPVVLAAREVPRGCLPGAGRGRRCPTRRRARPRRPTARWSSSRARSSWPRRSTRSPSCSAPWRRSARARARWSWSCRPRPGPRGWRRASSAAASPRRTSRRSGRARGRAGRSSSARAARRWRRCRGSPPPSSSTPTTTRCARAPRRPTTRRRCSPSAARARARRSGSRRPCPHPRSWAGGRPSRRARGPRGGPGWSWPTDATPTRTTARWRRRPSRRRASRSTRTSRSRSRGRAPAPRRRRARWPAGAAASSRAARRATRPSARSTASSTCADGHERRARFCAACGVDGPAARRARGHHAGARCGDPAGPPGQRGHRGDRRRPARARRRGHRGRASPGFAGARWSSWRTSTSTCWRRARARAGAAARCVGRAGRLVGAAVVAARVGRRPDAPRRTTRSSRRWCAATSSGLAEDAETRSPPSSAWRPTARRRWSPGEGAREFVAGVDARVGREGRRAPRSRFAPRRSTSCCDALAARRAARERASACAVECRGATGPGGNLWPVPTLPIRVYGDPVLDQPTAEVEQHRRSDLARAGRDDDRDHARGPRRGTGGQPGGRAQAALRLRQGRRARTSS